MPDETTIHLQQDMNSRYVRQWMELGAALRNPGYATLTHETLQETLRILSLRITCERTP